MLRKHPWLFSLVAALLSASALADEATGTARPSGAATTLFGLLAVLLLVAILGSLVLLLVMAAQQVVIGKPTVPPKA